MLWLILLKFVSAAVSVSLGAGILARDHRLRANRLIAAFLLCNAWWALGEFFLLQESDPIAATSLFRWMTLGWVPLGILSMHASLTLSSMDDHPVGRLIPPLYVSIGLLLPAAVFTDFVIADAEPHILGWRPVFGPGMALAYLAVAIPDIAILACWRKVMTAPESDGQLQLARVVFFGLMGSLVAGTTTAIVAPLLGSPAVGITTTLLSLVGLACAWTLHRFGHSLISSQALAREILDTLEDGIVLVGEAGDLRDANRAFLRMIRMDEAAAIGRPIGEWIPELLNASQGHDESTLLEVRAGRGETVPVVASAPVELHGVGGFVGRAYLLRDRREVVALQRRLIVSARLAAVGDLSKSISRSINEPVARTLDALEGLSSDWQAVQHVVTEADMASRCEEAVVEGQELIDECLEGVERISSIVREISGFSSDVSRKRFADHRLSTIVSRALRIARVSAPDWIDIECHLDENVGVHCHAAEIERVVTNILVNAIQSLEAKPHADAHLVVAVGGQGNRALIHVEDDGCGIDSDVLDRIFDPFFTTKPVGKGTGLGLAISYHIVKDHEGEIRISSIPECGTSVTVELPRLDSIEAVEVSDGSS